MKKHLLNRFNKISEEMKKRNINALLITDPDSIWYLTEVRVDPYERLFALYFDSELKEIKLFLNRLFNIPENDFSQIWFSDNDDYLKILSDSILFEGNLGVDKNIPARFLLPIMENKKNVNFLLGSECVDFSRGIKDSEEIELMKEASRINDECIKKALTFIKEGITETELAEYIDLQFKQNKAVPSFETTVCFGNNASDPHHTSENKQLKTGDCILIDMGCKKNNYCSDMTRTFFYKTVSSEMQKIYETVKLANETAISLIKPGIPLKEIDKAARKVIEDAGYGKYFTHRLGHFIGQTAHEWGEVSSISNLIAEEGMIFSIEPGIYIPETGGVRIEDLILVTKNGAQNLNQVDKNLIITD